MSRLQFITAIPLDVRLGSGCYVGTRTLAEGLRQLGVDVAMVTPQVKTPIYTLTRLLFNESLRWRKFEGDAAVGIDADGYTIAGRRNSLPHVACIKGVLGDVVHLKLAQPRQAWLCKRNLKPDMQGAPT